MASLEASLGNNHSAGIGIPNPTFSQIELRLAEQEALIAVLTERATRLRESVEMLERKALAVPVIEAEFSKLNRDYDVLKSNYETLLTRRESAKISGDREASGQKAQFRIVEPPVTPSSPSGPNRPLLLSAVLVLGVGAGIAVALGLSLMKSTYNTVNQLREDIDLPILGAITEIGSTRKTAMKSIDYSLFAACGALVLCLYGGTMLVERQIGLGRVSEVVRETRSIKPAIGLIFQGFSPSSARNVGMGADTGTGGARSQ
jgi:hypothetical protein